MQRTYYKPPLLIFGLNEETQIILVQRSVGSFLKQSQPSRLFLQLFKDILPSELLDQWCLLLVNTNQI